MKRITYIAALALTAGLFSCSKSNDSDDVQNPQGTTVRITSSGFSPLVLNVVAGTTVVWQDADQGSHTVVADDGSFDSGSMLPGATFNHTFPNIGNQNYHCGIHPAEKGTIAVKGIR
jgi:plastocyanin